MISRLSAKSIADAYYINFTEDLGIGVIGFQRDALFDFLFVNNFDNWLLNEIKEIPIGDGHRLRNFIMQLHTGGSAIPTIKGMNIIDSKSVGQQILLDLAECLIKESLSNPDFDKHDDKDKNVVEVMRKTLELDGYIYSSGVLLVPEESVINEVEETSIIEKLMTSVSLKDITTLKHHLDLSANHYQESHWDDSISNSRKVLEGVLAQVANRFNEAVIGDSLKEEILSRPSSVRDYLEKQGLIDKSEKETITQVYGLLSHTGGHPYMAQPDQARLMRHLALTFSQFILLRLEGVLKSNKRVN